MPLEHKRRPVRVRVLSQDGQIPGLLPRPWQALHVASLPPRFSYHPSSCRPNSLSSPRPRRVGRERTACAEAKTKEPKKKPRAAPGPSRTASDNANASTSLRIVFSLLAGSRPLGDRNAQRPTLATKAQGRGEAPPRHG